MGRIGARNMVIGGVLGTGISTALFSSIQFIPHDKTLIYTMSGFAIRTLQGIGTAASVTALLLLLVDTFPRTYTFILVST